MNYLSSYSNQDSALGLAADPRFRLHLFLKTYDIVLQSYNSSPTIPTDLVEANYEYENNTGALPDLTGPYVLREQAYWTILSGGAGQTIDGRMRERLWRRQQRHKSIYTENVEAPGTG